MKKYLMLALAVITLASCSKSEDLSESGRSVVGDAYKAAFLKYIGGSIASNQTWGFSSNAYSSAPVMSFTRASAVIPGDPFTFESTDNYYKTSVPAGVKTITEAIESCKRADWGWAIDYNQLQNVTDFNLTDGTWAVHLWSGSRNFYVSGSNVTLDVNGSNSINQARIYLLPGSTLNFNMESYINDLEIYVAAGATLNYHSQYLYKQAGGGKIYSRGTVNFDDNFEANQGSVVYNEGTMTGKDITSKPQDGNPSFFYNFGDLTLSGEMELNSCANFYNEGTVSVSGKTSVTQQKIWWINKGHYTTGTMDFSAKNTTFYNYCQLIVNGKAHMYDGEFNLMDNSYMEAGTADFDNFIVNMGGNSGFNIEGDTDWGAQGDGTYQGFIASGSNAYVRLGGTTTVAGHLRSLELTGKITYAINKIVDLGADNSGVQPTYVFNSGTTMVDFANLNVSYNDNDCGATWTQNTPPTPPTPPTPSTADIRIIAEDLSVNDASDFDFNDIVLDVTFGSPAVLTLQAAGGTLPLRINGDNNLEVHSLFGVSVSDMVNTGAGPSKAPVVIDSSKGFNMNINSREEAKNLQIEVQKGGTWYALTAEKAEPASKLAVDPTYDWLGERQSIKGTYPLFVNWATDNSFASKWWGD